MHRFDIKTIKNVELRRKTFKTTQNYKRNQITMNCIDLTSNDLKCWDTSQNYKSDHIMMNLSSIWRQNDHNNAKLRKWSNYNELHRFDVKTIKVELRPKTTLIKLQNFDSMSNDQKNYSKQRKTTKVIKLQWIASLWWRKTTIIDDLHRFDVKTIKKPKTKKAIK